MPDSAHLMHQMRFHSPEGRTEVLWVEEVQRETYRVLSVPVWAYGVSKGTIVAAKPADAKTLEFGRLVRESEGGTVRVIVPPDGQAASVVYLTRLIPDARQRGLFIGPATFFDPRLVAIHLRTRSSWWPEVGEFLDELVNAGVLEGWEVADPDQYASEFDEQAIEQVEPSTPPLVHPLPVTGSVGDHVS